MPGRRGFWILLLSLFAVLYLGSDGVELLVEWTWFSMQGYADLFRTIVLTEIAVGLCVGAVIFIFLYANLAWALRQIGDPGRFIPPEVAATPLGQMLTGRNIRRIALFGSLAIGGLTGVATASDWDVLLLFIYGAEFGQTDPVFGRDAGFFVFTLPLWERVQSLLWVLGLISTVGAGLIYLLRMQGEQAVPFKGSVRSLILTGFGRPERTHIAVLGAYMLIVIAFGSYLDRFAELYRPGGLFTGPGYADINGTIPVFALKIAAALVSAALLLYALPAKRYKLVIGIVGLLALVWIGGNGYSAVLQRFVVLPNEANKEAPYLVNHIQATNQAYDLHRVRERSLDGEAKLTRADIDRNYSTINNIRLWDHEPLLDTFSQIQEIRTYYDFVSVDNDRYVLDGELRQTMLSPREMQSDSLPSRTWVNERLIFTHGYGVALGPVNRVNEQGLPELFVKNIPPSTDYPELAVTRPEIYYGEVVDDYVFVKTDQKEFDYPEGDQNIFSTYEGKGGVEIGGFWQRLLFAIYLRDVKILLADDFSDETRVLLFRDVERRVNMIAPFFRYDRDPYMVIHDGGLYWILDGYTTTSRYPYAEVAEGIGNYMRNPVKVVVNAYDGDVRFYLVDDSDPIVKAYGAMFPGMIRPITDLDPGLRKHLRHPVDYFSVQAFMFATYHMLDPGTFYNKEDQWEVPIVDQKPMEPYYTVMKLPGEEKEEFILMLPFTPRLKDNLAAWMVARADGEHYGQLVVYRFPKQKLIFGPRQMAARINQNAEVSQQITLWDQSGSNVVRGTLLVIPIETSLIYIQPLYLKAEDGRIPELKRVIVGYENEIAMGLDLEDALGQIFTDGPRPALAEARTISGTATRPIGQAKSSQLGLTGQALAAYQTMERASRDGDWSRFGDALNRLGALLQELERAQP